MRNRAGIILCSGNCVLLIKRIKDGNIYYVVPGGGLKVGEDYEAAAKRELYEETGLCAENIKEFVSLSTDRGTEKYYFSVMANKCKVEISGEEANRQRELNQYIPEWIMIDELDEINLLPAELKKNIKNVLG